MSSAKLLFILSFTLFAFHINARHVRDAPQPTETEVSFTNLLEKAEAGLETLKDEIRKSLGVKDDEELKEKVLEQTKVMTEKFVDIKNDLEKQGESFANSEPVKELRQSVDNAVNELKAKHPETTKDLENFVDQAKKGSETILNKFTELKDSDEGRQLKTLADQFVAELMKVGSKITKDVQESLKTQQ